MQSLLESKSAALMCTYDNTKHIDMKKKIKYKIS